MGNLQWIARLGCETSDAVTFSLVSSTNQLLEQKVLLGLNGVKLKSLSHNISLLAFSPGPFDRTRGV